jgi:hypothetical protein
MGSPRCDLCNGGSDQNLYEIKVAGNQKLWTNGTLLLKKVQRLRRNLSSKFPSVQWRCDKLHVVKQLHWCDVMVRSL